MKYLFCDNLTDKHSDDSKEHWAESLFITSEASENWTGDVERAEKELEKIEGKKRWQDHIPNVSKYALFAGVILALAIVYEIAAKENSLVEVFQSRPWFFVACAAAFILAGALHLLGKSMTGEEPDNRQKQAARKRIYDAEQKVAESLDIPDNAIKTDILKFTYEEKPDHLEILFIGEYREMDMFVRDDALCLFDGANVYSFPKKEMTGIKVIDKEVLVGNWNKAEPEDSPRNMKFGVRPQMGLRFYCTLELEREGGKYSLLFPAYELENVQKLTGLEAPKLPGNSGKKKGKR